MKKPRSRVETRSALMPALEKARVEALFIRREDWRAACDDAFANLLLAKGVPAGRIVRIDNAPSSGTVVVCTDGDEEAAVEALRSVGANAVGLFGVVLPRLLASAPPRFAAGRAPEPDRGYALICLPRSGSTVLAQELKALGIGLPAEHIRDPIIAFARNRAVTGFDVRGWWRILSRSQVAGGTFGTKLIWGFLDGFLAKLRPGEVDWLLAEIRRLTLFHLVRADKVEQAVSQYVAQRTRTWHMWKRNVEEYSARLDAIGEVDFAELSAIHDSLLAMEDAVHAFLARLGVTAQAIPFEAIAADPRATAAGIGRAIGAEVDPAAIDAPIALERTYSPQHEAIAAAFRKHLGA